MAKLSWRVPGRLPVLILAYGLALGIGPSRLSSAEEAKPQLAVKSGNRLTVGVEQMHQVATVPVVSTAFPRVLPGIGQIAFNEDMSSVVQTPFSGRVTKLIAKVGDQVKAGDPLFDLDSPEVVQAQTDLIAAVQGLGKSRSALALAKRNLDRQTSLISGAATSARDLDAARNDFAAAESDLKTAEGALIAARNKLRVLMGRNEEEVARIERERIINPTITVNAPIAGTVVARKIGPGQYVRSDVNEPLFGIADLSTMWLKAAVPENDVASIRVGQEMEVRVAALADKTFRARVTQIGSASDATTRRITVRSELPNADGMLRAEMFATFKIVTDGRQETPCVPNTAIVWDNNDAVLWVKLDGRTFERRKVKTGRERDGVTQILEGVKPEDVVAGRGAIFIDNEWRQ